jgi:hypothetical protein
MVYRYDQDLGRKRSMRYLPSILLVAALLGATSPDLAVPRYDHIFVIVEENKGYGDVIGDPNAPTITQLAKTYGNYIAMVGGDTFGIHDDDAFYCKEGSTQAQCSAAALQPGYADHTVDTPTIGTQLESAGLTWKGYYESLPSPGSTAVVASDPSFGDGTRKTALYASKHSGFMNFASVQNDPHRAEKIVGFDRLADDFASGSVPNFALIVPNQCNEMHGLSGPNVPTDCTDGPALIRRGDDHVAALMHMIQSSPVWQTNGNVAIVITFDEASSKSREGCCGTDPASVANFGGGRIPTIVITNHGPRGVADPTPYSHYSLLRTIEDAFGIHNYLRHAGDTTAGVQPMVPLFATH